MLIPGLCAAERFHLDEIVDLRTPEGHILRGRIDYIDERNGCGCPELQGPSEALWVTGEGFADVDIQSQRRIIAVNLEDLMKSKPS